MKVTLFASILFSIFTFSSTAFAQDFSTAKTQAGKPSEMKKLEYKKAELILPVSSVEKGFENKVQSYNPSRVWRLRFYFTQQSKAVNSQKVLS